MPHSRSIRILLPLFVLLLVLGASGCGDGYPTDMTYGVRTDLLVEKNPATPPSSFGAPGQWPILDPSYKGDTANPAKLSSEQRRQLEKSLTDLFGTPAAPKVSRVEGVDENALTALRLDNQTLAEGSKLYRRHCLHCHGLTGDGRGPTGAWVNPHPRDYRPGKFKFTSSSQSEGTRKPRREDLLRVLRQGIEGTSMPSFGLLPEDELQKLASYVTHLSIRGQCEFDTMREAVQAGGPIGVDETVKRLLVDVIGYWREAETKLITPTSSPKVVTGPSHTDAEKSELQASISRGYKSFLGAPGSATSCISCHTNFGRTPNLKWDDWGTVVRPADLTTGIYRGGRRPIDIYWRIHSGIAGTGMPAYPAGADPAAINQEIWDVVNFVLALPYPGMLPENIRKDIYPTEATGTTTASRE
jgi:mono/diheme cytochrome c family protein